MAWSFLGVFLAERPFHNPAANKQYMPTLGTPLIFPVLSINNLQPQTISANSQHPHKSKKKKKPPQTKTQKI